MKNSLEMTCDHAMSPLKSNPRWLAAQLLRAISQSDVLRVWWSSIRGPNAMMGSFFEGI
jgi:hypothetical protein